MVISLALIFLVGLTAAAICRRIALPRIIGMLLAGILLGPFALNALDPGLLAVSADLRQIALIIILLKAGLSLDLSELRTVGRPAAMMCCVPATCEIVAVVLLAPTILGVTRTEAAVMGAVLAAVSPAVVVPRMVELIETGRGTNKGIPQMIMAGASCDDVFVIVLFSTFLGTAQGNSASLSVLADIPVSIVLGVALGAGCGWFLSVFFETAYARCHYVRNSMKVMIVLGTAFLLMAIETWAEAFVSVSGLLAVVSMACLLRIRCPPAGIPAAVREVWKTVAGSRGRAVRAGGRRCGRAVHPLRRAYRSGHDLSGTGLSVPWGSRLRNKHRSQWTGTAVLRHRLFA